MATCIPPEIELVTVAPDGVAKAVAELRNQYRLEFESDPPSAEVEVVVKERRGLPRLKVNWK